MNKVLSIAENVSYGIGILMLAYSAYVLVEWSRGKRRLEKKPFILPLLKGLLLLSPVVVGALLLPFINTKTPLGEALRTMGQNSDALRVAGAVLGSWLLYFGTTFLPHRNKYFNLGAPMVFLSPLPSITNASLIFIINSFLGNGDLSVVYMSFFFMLAVYVFTYTSRSIKLQSLVITRNITADLNRTIVRSVFLSDYQTFEKEKKSSLFMILGEDLNQISVFANNLVTFYTNILTVFIIMAYMLSMNVIAVLILLGVLLFILSIHYYMGVKSAVYFRQSAKVRSKYMEKLLGVINGFKELSIHGLKRDRYRGEVEKLSAEYTAINQTAYAKYINRVTVSDMSFIVSIGFSCFLLPMLFSMERQSLVSYILSALFLWGPINMIIKAIPELVSIRTALKRIRDYIGADKPFTPHLQETVSENQQPADPYFSREVDVLEASELYFEYKANQHSDEQYYIGPLDFHARAGEITFIIGGNGSGKTTFAKLLCGLYAPQQGGIAIDGREMDGKELGEYFSVIFSDFHLFRKVYSERKTSSSEQQRLLSMMKLDEKVSFADEEFNTIELSRGQSKRLALIQCLMENRPVFLFDECAADQDPDFKSFFYLELLPEIKRRGKILIVITHDDSYFDVADRIYKMETGKLRVIKEYAEASVDA
jgi:putative ATP-binding cassette transporter